MSLPFPSVYVPVYSQTARDAPPLSTSGNLEYDPLFQGTTTPWNDGRGLFDPSLPGITWNESSGLLGSDSANTITNKHPHPGELVWNAQPQANAVDVALPLSTSPFTSWETDSCSAAPFTSAHPSPGPPPPPDVHFDGYGVVGPPYFICRGCGRRFRSDNLNRHWRSHKPCRSAHKNFVSASFNSFQREVAAYALVQRARLYRLGLHSTQSRRILRNLLSAIIE